MSHPRRAVAALATIVLLAGGAVALAAGAFGQNDSHAVLGKVTAARVGPGTVFSRLQAHGYQLDLRLSPNRALVAGTVSLRLSSQGKPVNGARVRLTFTMLDMEMPGRTGLLPQTRSGRYEHSGPRLMFGRWGIRVRVVPSSGAPFAVNVIDRVGI